MSKISILSDILINKIAAGEVIERPASVVRELIDNSIDAGSSRIDIEVMHGGKKLIRVADDGSGMDRDDAVMCFERHATSKIRSEEELFDITTLGFRGEALPAIASVSKVIMTTSVPDSHAGVKIEKGAGKNKEIMDAPPLKGTTVEIRDIFYNTPARRKFLKTNPTELSHIIDTVVQKAFAYPEIAFSLKHNNSELLNSELLNAPPASDLKERFSQLYGEEMAEEFLRLNKESKSIKVSDSYRDVIPKERHPAYFIFLEIDPVKVDVNVHPAKREVKFERPDDIHRFVRAAVYEAFNPGIEIDVSQTPVSKGFGYQRGSGFPSPHHDHPVVSESASAVFGSAQTDFFASGITPDIQSFFHIGESFIATVSDDGLLIIDQHAAHERVLYERFLKKTAIQSESLFLPSRIELPLKEYNLIIKYKDFLKGLGLEVEDFGKNNIIIHSMPRELHRADLKGLLSDVASAILERNTDGIVEKSAEENLLMEISARLACHRSVRGRDPLNDEELGKLMADLNKCDEPDKCPHGRPTRIHLSLDQLNKMFKRK
jgi:DNA mismatch repair protein MutL